MPQIELIGLPEYGDPCPFCRRMIGFAGHYPDCDNCPCRYNPMVDKWEFIDGFAEPTIETLRQQDSKTPIKWVALID